jgi:hypothetical protein
LPRCRQSAQDSAVGAESLAFAGVQNKKAAMSHASNIVFCDGPDSPHAFDVVPLQPRNGSLDAMCPVCKGRGQWNTEIDLVSFRCKRMACDRCHGAGWVETGTDPVGLPDIEVSPEGYPRWTIRLEPSDTEVEVDPSNLVWPKPEPEQGDRA